MAKIILKSYRVTEKAAALQGNSNKYTFEVAADARATEIKTEVEKIFKVKVAKINTLNAKGKVKTSRMSKAKPGIKGKMKKAIVTLKAGEAIELV